MTDKLEILAPSGEPVRSMSGFEGAGDSFGGQLSNWHASPLSADAAILPEFDTGNARSEDLVRNDGYAKNAVQLHIDNIVGHQFKLVYKPNYQILGLEREALDEFVKDVEAKFTDFAEDPRCFIDAEQKRTFTMLIREGAGTHCKVGEITSKAEWYGKRGTPFKTCIRAINYARISNPKRKMDSGLLRSGVEMNKHGAAIAYHVRKTHPSDGMFSVFNDDWVKVPRETTWGRQQFLHIFEPDGEGQTRGTNNLLAALSKLKMLDKFQATTLQNAIVNAMYAAVIESDLGSEDVFRAIGGEKGNELVTNFMTAKADWHSATNINLGGVKIPHLLPSEKLSLQGVNAPSASLGEFENGILRSISKSLGVSFEELSGDFSKTNYSSARAAMGESFKYFAGKREVIAKRYARSIFTLWLEEAIQLGEVVLPTGARGDFYKMKSAWTGCNWIGIGRTKIDGLKSAKESIEKITAGLSTYEIEMGNEGLDYREVFDQQAREAKMLASDDRKPIWLIAGSLSGDEDEEKEDENGDKKATVTNSSPEVHNNA